MLQEVCGKLIAGVVRSWQYEGYICSYWASEASPTLGCSIKISRDICMYISVGGNTWAKRAHAQSQQECIMEKPVTEAHTSHNKMSS